VSGVLVDSNVLLDLMTEDERWFPWAASAVEHAADTSRLVINPVVYPCLRGGLRRLCAPRS